MVVLIHGGFFSTRFALTIETAIARLLAQRGAAVWNIEYRRVEEAGGGWPGTGGDSIAALRALDDVVPAALPADLAGRLDVDDVAVVGHSAGGLLAVWASAALSGRTRRTRITRVVAQSAVLDLTDPRARNRPTPRNLMGRHYDEIPERYAQASPILAPVFDARVVAIHAGDDAAVPVESSRRYVEAVVRVVNRPNWSSCREGTTRSSIHAAPALGRRCAHWCVMIRPLASLIGNLVVVRGYTGT